MFDQTLELQMKIMYASQDHYSEAHSRSVTLDLSQAMSPDDDKELQLQLKYRFLHVTDTGDLVPIYNSAQSVTASAAEVLISFQGHKGSGFERCQPLTQLLARGSQYQASKLPEMRKHDTYKVLAEAKYKDFHPIKFELEVRYLPNLDGRVRFVDIGTHVFFKKNERPQSPYVFYLANVMDDGRSEDYDNYQFVLNDGVKDYYVLEDQESEIQLPVADTNDVPKIGENTATVSANDLSFQDSSREFLTLPAQFTSIEIPLVS